MESRRRVWLTELIRPGDDIEHSGRTQIDEAGRAGWIAELAQARIETYAE